MLDQKLLLSELTKLEKSTPTKWPKYIKDAQEKGVILTDYLFDLGFFDENTLKNIIAAAYRVTPMEKLPEHLIKITEKYIPLSMARSQSIAIAGDTETDVTIITSNPDNTELFENLRKKIRKNMVITYAYKYEIDKALKEIKANLEEQFDNLKIGTLKDITSIESLKNSSKLLDIIFLNSIEYKASDIHIEPHEERILVRFRVDGILKDIIDLPTELAEIISSRIKVLANLRTDEHQKPQDGRFKLELPDGIEITTRVSILPVYQGEKIVMRILSQNRQRNQLSDLGFNKENEASIIDNIDKSHGMILVTGPTGSGKTTTLYTVLKLLNKPEVNLMTIEDPIEYRLDRVNQIQVNNTAGLSFADGLRSILRQDPDIVMVGEIRDEETASIAINASLTGHLVLATLHTNSSIDSLPRLLEMNVEAYLVASTVNIVVAQRLVRKLCNDCKEKQIFKKEMLTSLNQDKKDFSASFSKVIDQYLPDGTEIYQTKGCNKCNDTGYSGRNCITEVLNVTDEIKDLIYAKKSPIEIEKVAREQGYKSLIEDGFKQVTEGITSLSEIIRVLKD